MSIARFIYRNLSKLLSSRHVYITKSLSYKKSPLPLEPNYDYVRYASMSLCYEEIRNNNIQGSVAELGVYQGSFAAKINKLFKDRTFYLFDTFQGFDEKDKLIDKSKSFSNAEQDFSNTSIELVKKKLPYPENCVFKIGYFPETAVGLNDNFCFVSIDADLFEPVYAGLTFFYPLLQKGGYIFIHDFNNDEYKGAKQAVLNYCTENGINYVPLPDAGGTCVITK